MGLLEALHLKRATKTPPPNTVVEVKEAKADILLDLEDVLAEGGEGSEEESEAEDEKPGKYLAYDVPSVKKAALSPSDAVAGAQHSLDVEEEAFRRRKTMKKSEKIKVSTSQQEAAEKAQKAKDAKKARKAQEKEERGDRGLLDFLGSFGGKKEDKDATREEKAVQNRIDIAQALEKGDKEIKKFGNKPLGVLGALGKADTSIAKEVGKTLSDTNQGDDIFSASGGVATSTAGVASSLVDAGRAFRLYRKTHGAEKTVHLNETKAALGGAFGNLVNLTRSSLVVAEHSGALEAGSAVPLLGIIAAVPTLMAEINDLRSAMTRLAKQQSVYFAIEKQIEDGNTSQETLFTVVSSFIATDTEAIAKGLTRVTLDFTKIAGHGVTAGAITAPIGVALVAVAAAGKLALSGFEKVEDLVAANRANDRRKKLQPTLKASDDWKGLAKQRPESKSAAAMNQALATLARVRKGTPEHAKALDDLCTAADEVRKANEKTPKLVEFAEQLIDKARKEQADWADTGNNTTSTNNTNSANNTDDDDNINTTIATSTQPKPNNNNNNNNSSNSNAQGQQGGAQDAHQRNARKLMKQDPQVAAQALLNQALSEGRPGGPAFKVLKSFGIKATQLYSADEGDDKIANMREMRQKVLFKLGADDATAQTMTQSLVGAKDTAKDYLSMRVKHAELADYMKAKDKLKHGNNKSKRDTLWQ
ncbi:MAG: hypothetical protein ABI460_11775, partial [Caldimonas sp.]